MIQYQANIEGDLDEFEMSNSEIILLGYCLASNFVIDLELDR